MIGNAHRNRLRASFRELALFQIVGCAEHRGELRRDRAVGVNAGKKVALQVREPAHPRVFYVEKVLIVKTKCQSLGPCV